MRATQLDPRPFTGKLWMRLRHFAIKEKRDVSVEEINAAMREYANGPMKGILDYTEEELVSSDLIGNEFSSIYSAPDTIGLGNLVKVLAWYDNEWGYSCRVADLVEMLVQKGLKTLVNA